MFYYYFNVLKVINTNILLCFRLLQMRTVACCCIKGTMITSPWSCTGDASGSATILDLTLLLLYTGTCTYQQKCHSDMMDDTNVKTQSLPAVPLSVETVNDGSFHAVELVASDQTLSLSIDGGAPKSINSISKQSTLNIDSPLYLGGKDTSTSGLFVKTIIKTHKYIIFDSALHIVVMCDE